MRRIVSLAAVALAAVLLAGCSLLPFGNDDPVTGGSDGGGGSGGNSQEGEGDQGGDGDDGAVSTGPGQLPASWPDSVYVVDGEVLNAVESAGNWVAQIGVEDAVAAFAEVAAQLKAAGFTAIAETTSEVGSIGVYENDQFQVQVLANDDSGAPSVYYTIVSKG